MFGAKKITAIEGSDQVSDGADAETETASPQEKTEEPTVENPSPEEKETGSGEQSSNGLPSIDGWVSDIVFPFLDLMDITSVTERRKALLSLESGKKEENIVAILKIADAYLHLLQLYFQDTAPDDAVSALAVKTYMNKSASMKAWIGI